MKDIYLKISIITVVYNAVNTIEQTIKSVINQSYKNMEYIIIDGGSTDGTIEIIRQYEEYISFWISETDQGIYDAMNKGIKIATGDIVAFINADDTYENGILEKVCRSFENNDVDIIYGKVRKIYSNGYELVVKPLAESNLHISMCMCHQAVFTKRELFLKYGLFNLNYRIAADYEALLKWYSARAQFMYIDEVIANYGVEGLSSVEVEKCGEEVYKIAVSYLDSPEKKEKYRLAIEERKLLLDKKVKRRQYLLNNKSTVVENLNNFVDDTKRLFIFGCGQEAVECYKLLTENKILFHGYIDNDIKKHGMKLREYYIYSPDVLKNGKEKVIVSSVKYGQEISGQLERMGYKRKEDFIFLEDLVEE